MVPSFSSASQCPCSEIALTSISYLVTGCGEWLCWSGDAPCLTQIILLRLVRGSLNKKELGSSELSHGQVGNPNTAVLKQRQNHSCPFQGIWRSSSFALKDSITRWHWLHCVEESKDTKVDRAVEWGVLINPTLGSLQPGVIFCTLWTFGFPTWL